MLVDIATAGDWAVQGPNSNIQKALAMAKSKLSSGLMKPLFKTENRVIHSTSILPSGRVNALNGNSADILHLHWVQGEMLSVSDIGRLIRPVVWTLHDMWAFCGAEHYTEEFRWREGYRTDNRPGYESGFDINRWVWKRKQKLWKTPRHIVTPSRWLGQCVKDSALMGDWPVSVVPNTIDTKQWQPVNTSLARELLRLPKDVPLLLFGAMGGGRDPRKGFDLLQAALKRLQGEGSKLQLVVFGELPPKVIPDYGFPIHYTGHLHDELTLRVLYSAADVFVLPSRQDNLPNTGVEASACGTPVVAFNTCGLPDIVSHKETGYLAEAFSTEDLAKGITWVLEDAERHARLSAAARSRAVRLWSPDVVVPQYLAVYEQAIQSWSDSARV